ncbi:Uncharacterised protein [Bordetella pertussis]|nr:Uncharacterised protein [Bordetella pertussis]
MLKGGGHAHGAVGHGLVQGGFELSASSEGSACSTM